MREKIGSVCLEYKYYTGDDLYTDGGIEDEMLDAAKMGEEKDMLKKSDNWAVLYHLSEIRENLVEWITFPVNANTLEIGSGCGALTGLLASKSKNVTCVELSKKRSLINAYRHKMVGNIEIIVGNFEEIEFSEKYDVITLIGVLEYAALYIHSQEPYLDFLRRVGELLKPDGMLILAIENKMGLKYWNCAPEDHTGIVYDGINDYRSDKDIRTFSKPELARLIDDAGFCDTQFYYPVPDYKLPDLIYSDRYLPKPGDIRLYNRDYSASRRYAFNDAIAFDQVCGDGEFPYFSNSFLVLCGKCKDKAIFSKYNRERREKFRIVTTIVENNGSRNVIKKSLNGSDEHIRCIHNNEKNIKPFSNNIITAQSELKDGVHYQKYISGLNIDNLFYNYRMDTDVFINKVKKIVGDYLTPDEVSLSEFYITKDFLEIFGNEYPEKSKSLPVTNVDATLSNLIQFGEKVYSVDGEWIFNFPIPYEYVVWRSVTQLYLKYEPYLKRKITKDEYWDALGISNTSIFGSMELCFSEYVHGKNDCEKYLKKFIKPLL